MALEIGVGLAHLSGRRLSMPWHDEIGPAPGPRPAGAAPGDPRPKVLDLWDVPVDIVDDAEWDLVGRAVDGPALPWGDYGHCVYLADPDAIPHPGVRDFANGRTRYVRIPESDDPVISVAGRPLSLYSYFFHATGSTRRGLLETLAGVRLHAAYRDVAEQIADDLGRVNVTHIRRTDLVQGIRAYAGVSPEHIATTLASVLPTEATLVVATEADATSSLFDPIRARFADVVFMTDVILGDHGDAFGSLPFHEDNALGAITQEIAARADHFVGTLGSTFTALIQRMRVQRDHGSPFLFTADFTPKGPRFTKARYRDRADGRYSWNRIGIAVSPDVLAWLREWPEAAISADDDVAESSDRRSDDSLPIHSVVCTDTQAYGDWQCEFQEYTWARVRQPGELVHLVACPDGEKPTTTSHSRVITTGARNDHPDAPESYAGFNRLWSLQEWLRLERPSGSVLILDADFVFRGPIRMSTEPGRIVAQEWHGQGTVGNIRRRMEPLIGAGLERVEPFTWPVIIDAGDLGRIMPRWIELTAELRRTTGAWESDMYALVGAVAEADLSVRYETLGAWMDWPEEFVAGAPIIHYCQPVRDREGSEIWYKQSYRPWEPLNVDPNDASLDYTRDLLHLLDEYVRFRNS